MKISSVSDVDIINHLKDSGYSGKVILVLGIVRTKNFENEGPAADAFIERPFP